MSKGNILLGYARGKVGDLVFVRRNGEQVVRPYVSTVKNPQTRSQMEQRVKWPNLVAAWRVLKPYIQLGMQDKKPSQSDYNAFISRNLANNNAYLLKEEVKQGAMLVAPYILTSGSLGLCSMDTATRSSIIVDMGLDLATASIGQVSQSIMAYNANYAIGDQITIIVLGQVLSAGVPSVVPAAYKFILTAFENATPFTDVVEIYGSINPVASDGFLGYEFFDVNYQGYGAACIHSRLSAQGILEVSTSAMLTFFDAGAPLGQSTPFGVSMEEAINSYGVSEGVFLNPSSFGEVDFVPVASVDMSDVVVDNQSLASNGTLSLDTFRDTFFAASVSSENVESLSATSVEIKIGTKSPLHCTNVALAGSSLSAKLPNFTTGLAGNGQSVLVTAKFLADGVEIVRTLTFVNMNVTITSNPI